MAMPGKAMVAATEATLTIAPPWPAGPPARMARKPCLMPSDVPSTFTSSIRRASSAFRSASRLVISTPALLTTMSRPPRQLKISGIARSQLSSEVTSSDTNSAVPPAFRSESAHVLPRSPRMSPITTEAPARASAWAIPSPAPRPPPVTSALRPARSYTLIRHLFFPRPRRLRTSGCDVPHSLLAMLDSCQDKVGRSSKGFRPAVKPGETGHRGPAFSGLAGILGEPRNDRTLTLTEVKERNRDRVARRQVDKFAERRGQLAPAALQTLAELGYARTSLRDIAQNSEFSHGVLHYYFSDKFELITYCVRQYKAECVTRYDNAVTTATTTAELKQGFGAAMAGTLREDATLHRLWYDLRNQSQFEEAFRADAREIDGSLERMIWRIVSKFAELSGTAPVVTPAVAYAMFDGLFQHALISHLAGNDAAAPDLEQNVARLLESLFPCPA